MENMWKMKGKLNLSLKEPTDKYVQYVNKLDKKYVGGGAPYGYAIVMSIYRYVINISIFLKYRLISMRQNKIPIFFGSFLTVVFTVWFLFSQFWLVWVLLQ